MKRKSARLSSETGCSSVGVCHEVESRRHKGVLCDSNGHDLGSAAINDSQKSSCAGAAPSLSSDVEYQLQQCTGVKGSLDTSHLAATESQQPKVNSEATAVPNPKTPSSTPNLNAIISDVVNKRMKDEEEKLHKLNAQREDDATRSFLEEWEMAQEKEKEERYEKLQLLLTKSELYTKYLLERIGQQKQLTAESPADSCPPPNKKVKISKQSGTRASSNNEESVSNSQDSQASQTDRALSNGCPLLFVGALRPYQVDGLIWLNTMFENGVNGILADEMGLGKTVQCIAALAHLITMDVRGPFLVVAPLSTLPNWMNEFKRFAPKVPVMLYHGPKNVREEMIKEIYKSTLVDGQWWTQPVVCTSYEVALADRRQMMSMHWKYLIVDEGQRIKNSQCRLIKALRLYDSTHRVLLTGTPLQNNLSELWSLLNFLLPEVFDDLDSFEYWFQLDCLKKDQQKRFIADEKKMNVLAMLHKIMTPFILRRLKCDVELNLPPKQEILVYAPLANQQKAFYEATLEKTIHRLLNKVEQTAEDADAAESKGDVKARRRSTTKVNYALQMEDDVDADSDSDIENWVEEITELTARKGKASVTEQKVVTHVRNVKMNNRVMQLRKCSSHPYLISQPVDPQTGFCKIDEEVVNSSGKMLLLDAMLSELKSRGHKVLIFSQMTKMLDLIEDYCHVRQHEYCRLDGSTNIDDRREQMECFNSDSSCFLFLLSTRAGGLGINLCAADTVIIYDSDWNPQCDLQAQDRAHRIGQTKPVVVYRLVCAGTIDEQIVERAARKRRLEKMVIHKGKFKTGMTESYSESCKSISPDELLELLKSHDHAAVVEVANRKEVISKRELNALLDRSSLLEQWAVSRGQHRGEVKDKKKSQVKRSKKGSPGAGDLDMTKVFKVVDDGRESHIEHPQTS